MAARLYRRGRHGRRLVGRYRHGKLAEQARLIWEQQQANNQP